MFKTSLMAASMAVLVLSPAFGGTQACTWRREATSLDMSKATMKKGDTAGCMKHMAQAHSHGPLIQGE